VQPSKCVCIYGENWSTADPVQTAHVTSPEVKFLKEIYFGFLKNTPMKDSKSAKI
jgi:hypothetical protein